MRKEVSLYLFVGLLAVGTFLAVYYLNIGLTGYAVFEQNTCASFDEGVYLNSACDSNLRSVVLGSNQTSGEYTSKVFDASSSSRWDNLTMQQTTPAGTSVLFEVRNCSLANCSDSSFVSASDLNNLNLTGQYFQYKAFLNGTSALDNVTNTTVFTSPSLTNVSIGHSAISVSVQTSLSISQPSGTKSSGSGIPLTFSAVGEGLSCWYDVHDSSDGAEIMANTSITDCSNSTTFDLGAGNGNYVLNLYANGTSGFASKSSGFTISIVSNSSTSATETPTEAPSTVQVPVSPSVVTPAKVTALTALAVVAPTLVPGSSEQAKWTVQNTGTEPISACVLKANGGDYASWISVPDKSYNMNAGQSQEFVFVLSAPNSTADGSYSLSVSVECAETAVAKDFTLVVEKKKLDFEILDAQRTRTDRVRVIYSLKELTGKGQNVTVQFLLLDAANREVANSSQNRTISANSSKEFTVNIPINGSVNGSFVGNYSLSATANSEVYKASVLAPIVLGTPVGGFAVFTGLGTGNYTLLIAMVLILVGLFLVFRRMRKTGKTMKDIAK